ncbi:MAG: outer membrane protein assembly factor BamD [Verrucomicrobiota bacterium]|jgi:outer membrane protein assembly factor BamD
MNRLVRIPILATVGALAFAGLTDAAVVFKPGAKAKYVAPGEEEMSGNAEQLFHVGQEAESRGNLHRAIKAYRSLVRKHPKDSLAPGAGFRAAELLEAVHDYLTAAGAYRHIVEAYPASPHFDQAIEAQFRIGEMYLNGRKVKLFGLSVSDPLERSVEIFAAIIRTAPYGKYTARAQFDIGLAREKEKITDAALSAYQAVVDKFPNDPVTPSAQYQIGYIWLTAAKTGTKDLDATDRARTAFQDFLFRFPNSEKAPQARANLELLSKKKTSTAFDIAKFYDKQKHYRAAVIYYNEVIRQQPGSTESEKAKKRIDQIKAKVGEKALLPVGDATAVAKKEKTGESSTHGQQMSGNAPPSSAPLPPADADASLPPAASLLPDATTAPPGSFLSGPPSSAAEPSPSPDATASPAP